MLKFVFWSLLVLNAVVFVVARGGAAGGEHEPDRVKRQFNTARIMLLTGEQADALAKQAAARAAETEPAAPAPDDASAAPAPAPAPTIACTEVGTFDAAEARRFDTRLAALDLGERSSRQARQEQDVSSWLVNIPPQGNKEAADRKAGELRNLGISNFFIMQGDSPLKWAISLGVFKTETGAQIFLAQLNKQGVRTARITPRGPQETVYSYRFRNVTAAQRDGIVAAAKAAGAADVTACR